MEQFKRISKSFKRGGFLVEINDDFGNTVKMNKEEAALIAGAVEQLKTFEGENKSKILKSAGD